MKKHATITVAGYTIPLIGIDSHATLQECDCCHDEFGIQSVELTGVQFLCSKCKGDNNNNELQRTHRKVLG